MQKYTRCLLGKKIKIKIVRIKITKTRKNFPNQEMYIAYQNN